MQKKILKLRAKKERNTASNIVQNRNEVRKTLKLVRKRFKVSVHKKNRKRKSKEKQKQKIIIKKIKKRIKKLPLVIPDKMCVYSFCPIPDSQQCAKRGSCKHPFSSETYFLVLTFSSLFFRILFLFLLLFLFYF